MSESDNDYRPTVDDVDPSALAVNSVDDHVRVSADPSESEIVDSAGETLRVDEDSDGDRVQAPDDHAGESRDLEADSSGDGSPDAGSSDGTSSDVGSLNAGVPDGGSSDTDAAGQAGGRS